MFEIKLLLTTLFGLQYVGHIATGSRVFGDATDESDHDFVIYQDDIGEALLDRLKAEGFETCNESKHADDKHLIVKRPVDKVNLIFTNCPHKFDVWTRCTEASKMLNLTKDQRQVLFSQLIDDQHIIE